MNHKHWFCFFLLCVGVVVSGCIRVSGGAGVGYQGADDPAPKVKSVGFDTQKLIPGMTPGNIQMAEV